MGVFIKFALSNYDFVVVFCFRLLARKSLGLKRSIFFTPCIFTRSFRLLCFSLYFDPSFVGSSMYSHFLMLFFCVL